MINKYLYNIILTKCMKHCQRKSSSQNGFYLWYKYYHRWNVQYNDLACDTFWGGRGRRISKLVRCRFNSILEKLLCRCSFSAATVCLICTIWGHNCVDAFITMTLKILVFPTLMHHCGNAVQWCNQWKITKDWCAHFMSLFSQFENRL